MLRFNKKLFFIVAVLAVAALSGSLLLSQIPKKDYYGTWYINHDGWEGTLILKATGEAGTIQGTYIGGDGVEHAVKGTVDSHNITFTIDMKDTPKKDEDDQMFEGYLFTQSRSGLAGHTVWSNAKYGWYATKTSDSTEIPEPAAEPVVAEDFPDPQPAQGGLDLSTSQSVYEVGEPVAFVIKNFHFDPVSIGSNFFIIQYREDNKPKEFYTGKYQPMTLEPGEERQFTWDQWDNEHQHKAQPGVWRIIFRAPDVTDKPLRAVFRIKPQ